MNFSELQSEVVALTKRSDLLSTTIAAGIKAATLKLHQADFYSRDLVEAVITFPSAEYLQSFDTTSTFPRYRALKYLRKIDPTSGQYVANAPPLDILVPEQLMNGQYLIERTDCAYQAGSAINIKCSAEIQSFGIGYYQHPDVATATYSSWIADQYPYAIIFEAAANVFKSIGYTQEESSMRLLAAEQLAILKINNIQTVGY